MRYFKAPPNYIFKPENHDLSSQRAKINFRVYPPSPPIVVMQNFHTAYDIRRLSSTEPVSFIDTLGYEELQENGKYILINNQEAKELGILENPIIATTDMSDDEIYRRRKIGLTRYDPVAEQKIKPSPVADAFDLLILETYIHERFIKNLVKSALTVFDNYLTQLYGKNYSLTIRNMHFGRGLKELMTDSDTYIRHFFLNSAVSHNRLFHFSREQLRRFIKDDLRQNPEQKDEFANDYPNLHKLLFKKDYYSKYSKNKLAMRDSFCILCAEYYTCLHAEIKFESQHKSASKKDKKVFFNEYLLPILKIILKESDDSKAKKALKDVPYRSPALPTGKLFISDSRPNKYFISTVLHEFALEIDENQAPSQSYIKKLVDDEINYK